MARRVSLPSADDLFRRTTQAPQDDASAGQDDPPLEARLAAAPEPPGDPADEGARRSSGRVRHDEKMTVYVTSAELLDLEHARLSLRREHGLAVDRGRLVREAIAMALADLESGGSDSALVHRLSTP